MPGYPNRIRRATLGPTLEDTWPVVDPRKAIGASSYNLAWWQLAGASLVSPLALIGVKVNSSGVPITVFQALAFDPDGAQPLLLWTHAATGAYTFSFPQAKYPDEAGNLITLSLVGGRVDTQTLIGADPLTIGVYEKLGVRSGKVHTSAGGVAADMGTDGEFLVTLY